MSDFFSDLMARIDGTAPVLRPRLPSLFETTPTDPGFQPDAEPQVEGAEQMSQPRPQSGSSPERAEVRTPEPSTQNPFRPAPVSSTPTAAEPASHSRPSQVRGEDVRETIRTATPPPSAGAEMRRQIVNAPDRTQGTHASHETPARDARQLLGQVPPVPVEPIQPAATIRAIPPPPPIAPSTLRLRPNLAQRSQAPKREAEPSIRVSIGRIEIRATSDAPRPAKPKTSPVMSLDEYLRSRSR